MERDGATREEIGAYGDEFYCHEDPDRAIMPAGQIAGLIGAVASVGEVIETIMRQARSRLHDIEDIFGGRT
jgi:NAD(P)H-dependent flavin oxidoreductase YrpB (nitropropane dioxygenase family)